MRSLERSIGRLAVVACLLVAALALVACGSSGSSSKKSSGGGGSSSSGGGSTSGGGKQGGSATVLMGTAPDYLDPNEGYTTQSAEATWISYTGLLTYKHATGTAGGQLIPGLAEALPKVSNGGKTYALTLRKGLKFSDGKPVKASDFVYSVERMLRLNWGGKSFVTSYVKGAAAYDSKKAKSISGIKADDSSGKITITLTQPYGAFANVLAFPSLGFVPTGTPMKNLSNNPPPGVGPYMITNVTPNQGWTMKKNPNFAGLHIPGIPTGHLDTINVKINSNTQSEAQQVLSNQADVFDPGDTIPPALLPQINSQAKDRFAKEIVPSTFYAFLNVTKPPFNNAMAREAVNVGIDRSAFERLASGFLKPGCFFLPEGIAGHPTGPCPWGAPTGANIAKAKQMLQKSGQMGAKVTVWGEQREPRKEYIDYYTNQLNKIGFKATEKIISDTTYFPTIGNAKTTDPQTGFADWIQDFPNPSDFYLLLDANSIQPTNNENFGKVNDPHVQSELKTLNTVPAAKLQSVASRWEALDKYVAQKAYVYVFGSEQVPKFFSDRLNFGSAIFHSTYFIDWTSLQLK